MAEYFVNWLLSFYCISFYSTFLVGPPTKYRNMNWSTQVGPLTCPRNLRAKTNGMGIHSGPLGNICGSCTGFQACPLRTRRVCRSCSIGAIQKCPRVEMDWSGNSQGPLRSSCEEERDGEVLICGRVCSHPRIFGCVLSRSLRGTRGPCASSGLSSLWPFAALPNTGIKLLNVGHSSR